MNSYDEIDKIESQEETHGKKLVNAKDLTI